MQSFKTAYINELERMCKNKKLLKFIILDLIICSLFFVTGKVFRLTQIGITSQSTALSILSLFCLFVFPIYVIMETMEIFSGQYADKTILNILARPVSRFKVYSSKLLAVTTFILFHSIVVLAVTICFNFSRNISVFMLICAFLISIVPQAAFAALIALIAQTIKNGMFGMLICIMVLLASKAIGIFSVIPSAFLFTSYLDWYKMFIRSNPAYLHTFSTGLLIIASGIAFFFAGYMLFEKKEF